MPSVTSEYICLTYHVLSLHKLLFLLLDGFRVLQLFAFVCLAAVRNNGFIEVFVQDRGEGGAGKDPVADRRM